MVQFCPKCEKILRKKRDATSIFLICTGCGYKEHVQEVDPKSVRTYHFPEEKAENFNEIRVGKKIHLRSENMDSYNALTSDKGKFSEESESSTKPIKKIEEEILLFEIKKNNFIRMIESYSDPKREEMAVEVIHLLQNIQELKIKRNNYYKNGSLKNESLHSETKSGDIKDTPTILNILSLGSKRTLEWVTKIHEKLVHSYPNLIIQKTQYWQCYETELEHLPLIYLWPFKNQIYIGHFSKGFSAAKLIANIFIVESEEKIEKAIELILTSIEITLLRILS